MRAKEKLLSFFKNERVLISIIIYALSGVAFYGEAFPLLTASLFAVGGFYKPTYLLFALLGFIRQDMAFATFLRQIIAAISIFFAKRFAKKVPNEVLCACGIILGGIASFLITDRSLLDLKFTFLESITATLFCPVLKIAYETLRSKERRRNASEIEFFLVFLFILTLSLSFAEIEIGKVTLTSLMIIFMGMAVSLRSSVPTATMCNMIAGFLFFAFTPHNTTVVAYLSLAGFMASFLKRFSPFLIPCTYLLLVPFFFFENILSYSLSLEDILFAALFNVITPIKAYDILDVVTKADIKRRSYIVLNEKLGNLSDTFMSISNIFKVVERKEETEEDGISPAKELVCKTCRRKTICQVDVDENLNKVASLMAEGKKGDMSAVLDSRCIRRKELFLEFSKNYQIKRLEALWQERMREEKEALSGQMECISGVFRKLLGEKDFGIERDKELEKELMSKIKKAGINVKKVSAGKNEDGKLKVLLESTPCKKSDLCETKIPEIIYDVTGIKMERYGLKNCENCNLSFVEEAPFKVDIGYFQMPYENVSGDSAIFSRIDEKHFLIALSDGMGTGKNAREGSYVAVQLAAKLLSVGMDMESAVKMINSLLLSRGGGKEFATLDLSLINLMTGEVKYLKCSAQEGYVLTCGGKCIKLSSSGSPLGIIGALEVDVKTFKLKEGDMLILLTDGAIDSVGEKGISVIESAIKDFSLGNANDLVTFIAEKVLKETGKNIKDDITIIAGGCIKARKTGNTMEKRRLKA